MTNSINFDVDLEEKGKRKVKGLKSLVFQPYESEAMINIMKMKINLVKKMMDVEIEFP